MNKVFGLLFTGLRNTARISFALKFWRYFALIIFIVFPLINTIVIGIQTQDPNEAFNYIYPTLAEPSLNLQESSKALINLGGFEFSFTFIKIIYKMFQSMWITIEWFLVISFFILHLVVQDTSKATAAYSTGILITVLLQSVVITYIEFSNGNITPFIPLIPITSILYFMYALAFLFTGLKLDFISV